MRSKTIVNGKGEPWKTRVEIPLEVGQGTLGIRAVANLMALIETLKSMETEEELAGLVCKIHGYAECCRQSGFIKSTDDLMDLAEYLAGNELTRIREREVRNG